MLPRLLLVAAPFLAAFAALFGAWYLWLAVQAGIAGRTGNAVFGAAFGIAGIALSMSLWQTWRRSRNAGRRPPQA